MCPRACPLASPAGTARCPLPTARWHRKPCAGAHLRPNSQAPVREGVLSIPALHRQGAEPCAAAQAEQEAAVRAAAVATSRRAGQRSSRLGRCCNRSGRRCYARPEAGPRCGAAEAAAAHAARSADPNPGRRRHHAWPGARCCLLTRHPLQMEVPNWADVVKTASYKELAVRLPPRRASPPLLLACSPRAAPRSPMTRTGSSSAPQAWPARST